MSIRLEEEIFATLDEIASRIRTPAEQSRFAAVIDRLLESDNADDRWLGVGVMLALADAAEAQYEREMEGRHWDVLVVGRTGETRAFHFVASEDVQGDFTALAQEHKGVWGERMGSGCLPEAAALRIAEMLNQTVGGERQ